MSRELIDVLWRDHPAAPRRGARGPRSRVTTSDVVDQAIALADAESLEAVTIRALAERLGISPMSVYTHVNNREDLLVLMVDGAHAQMVLPRWTDQRWRPRVRQVAEANRALLRAHPWLPQIADPRSAIGPGTIAKYDHELEAFDGTGLDPLERDAALTFVLDWVRTSAPAWTDHPATARFGEFWERTAATLGSYVGDDFPLAREVGAAAGAANGAPYDAHRAWDFGLTRVVAGLSDLIEGAPPP